MHWSKDNKQISFYWYQWIYIKILQTLSIIQSYNVWWGKNMVIKQLTDRIIVAQNDYYLEYEHKQYDYYDIPRLETIAEKVKLKNHVE